MEAIPRELFFLEAQRVRRAPPGVRGTSRRAPFCACSSKAGGVPAWLDRLEKSDKAGYDAIIARLERLEDGNLGDYKFTGNVIELRFIQTGPGYRLYVGLDGDLAIILWAGIKKTQDADVKIANKLWKEYKGA